MISRDELEWMRGFVARNTWTFAKTMPDNPHQWAARKDVANNADFDRFVTNIREHGYQQPFWRKLYGAFHLDHWQYWTMGWPVVETTIINRAVAKAYSSALATGRNASALESERVSRETSVALRHDLMETRALPPEFLACDVLYAEPPWRDGFRTKAMGPDFVAFMERVAAIIKTSTCPVVVLSGFKDAQMLPAPDSAMGVELNGGKAMALCYGLVLPFTASVPNHRVIEYLASRYDRVGDFCCGFGNTGKIFMQNGKAFTMSDRDPSCIGYIEQNVRGWGAPDWKPS